MYGCGDVASPDVDTVDYMEDLVVEFLSDLVSWPRVTICPADTLVSVDLFHRSDPLLHPHTRLHLLLPISYATAYPARHPFASI
jgi:hypothetical protein